MAIACNPKLNDAPNAKRSPGPNRPMSTLRFLLLVAPMLVGLVACASFVARPSTTVRVRRQLFTLTVLGTPMPYAIHGLQVYESLTIVSSAAGLAIGRYPVLDRWGRLVSTSDRIAHASCVAGLAHETLRRGPDSRHYGRGISLWLPYALGRRGSGTSPTAPPMSWLIWAILVGVVVTAAAARTVSQAGTELSTESVS